MPDMLVRLYDLPDSRPIMAKMEEQGITIRRAIAPEKHVVLDWIKEFFGRLDERGGCGHVQSPSTCIIAVDEAQQKIAGFACYEATNRLLWPTGVDPAYRGRGIGKRCSWQLWRALESLAMPMLLLAGQGQWSFTQDCRCYTHPRFIPWNLPGLAQALKPELFCLGTR